MAIGWRCDGARHVHTLLALGPIGDLSDGQLLERFALRDGERSEMAFAALVERHGPMVLRTCRAILRDGHDAHDAFQATFLVLARRAGSLWVGESLAAWLHQVARRTALCARSASARRRRHETRAASLTPLVAPDDSPDDLGDVLHAEIARLPARYREAVVLCLLEGLAHEQAAHRLGCPVGTLQSRLARGRERLRVRLTRRGLSPSAGPTMVVVPPTVVASTARVATCYAAGRISAGMVSVSVLALFKEVSNMMFFSKLRSVALASLCIGLGISGVAVLANPDEPTQSALSTQPGGGASTPKPVPAPPSPDARVLRIPVPEDGSSFQIIRSRNSPDGNSYTAVILEIKQDKGKLLVKQIEHLQHLNGGKLVSTSFQEVPCDSIEIVPPDSTKLTGSLSTKDFKKEEAKSQIDFNSKSQIDFNPVIPKGVDLPGGTPSKIEVGEFHLTTLDPSPPSLPGSRNGKIDTGEAQKGLGMVGIPKKTSPQDRRLDEMERKLNLILDKLDGPKAGAK